MTAVSSLAAIVTVLFLVFLALDHCVGANAAVEMSMVWVALRIVAITAC
jgi:hypothetical protein